MRESVRVDPYEMYLIAAMLPTEDPFRKAIEEQLLSHPQITKMATEGNSRFLAYRDSLNEARVTHPELGLDSVTEALGAIFLKRNSQCSFCMKSPRGAVEDCIYIPNASEFKEGRGTLAIVPKDRFHPKEHQHAILPSSHELSDYQRRQFWMVNQPLRGMVTWRLEIHGFRGSVLSRLLQKGNWATVAIDGEHYETVFRSLEIQKIGNEGIAIELEPEQILQVLAAGTQGKRIVIVRRMNPLFCADFEFGFTFVIPKGPDDSSPVYWTGERQFYLGAGYLLQDIPFQMAVELVRRYPWVRCFRSSPWLSVVREAQLGIRTEA